MDKAAGSAGGGSVSWSGSDHSDDDQNHESEEPRGFFKAGDRVRVNNSSGNIDDYLQKDNRAGTVVSVRFGGLCWLQMDKPVIREVDGWDEGNRPSIISQGCAYFASREELELLESVPESQKSLDIKAWRRNLKPGDKVRVCKDQADMTGILGKWKGSVVTLKVPIFNSWAIEEVNGWWDVCRFEPVEKTELGKPKKAKELKKQPLDPRLKKLIQNAQGLIQDIEKAFKDSQKYPIFGINLAKQEPVEKIKKDDLGESLLSLGVVLYHLYTGQSEHNNHSYLLDGYPKPKDMPEELWKVVNKLLKSEHRSLDEFKKDLKQLKKVLKEGVVEDLGKSEESIENQGAKKIWQTQVDRLIELGCRKSLNVSKEELAKIIPLPDSWMENPLLVVPKNIIGIQQQMKMIEVDGKHGECVIDLDELKNLAGIETPNTFYWIDLIQDGKDHLGRPPAESLKSFFSEERGLTVAEGVALIAQYPQALKHHYIHLIGSQSNSCVANLSLLPQYQGCTPVLSWWGLSSKSSKWGAASCYYAPRKQTNMDSS